ncbi:hypothetical protein AVEN_10581-1 [Araneus ventricosus]|uniref:Uncharacterized protein n=1 Tax=Araneus ventricosus TaxID=182803 RepID=A0A4Y2Q2B8_ARAVE|nr:hypothetical protein AVEN_10581-1 [Araneus ventricosus]
MPPIDSRQLENVKGKLLKFTKKETMAQRSLDRREEETEEQNNSRLSVMESMLGMCLLPHFFSRPGNDALFDIARATPGHVWNSILFEIAYARYLEVTIFALFNSRFFGCLKEKEVTGDASCRQQAIRKRERRVVETDEERNCRLSTMSQRGQDIKAEETEEQNNSD